MPSLVVWFLVKGLLQGLVECNHFRGVLASVEPARALLDGADSLYLRVCVDPLLLP